jgi:hypothetical protein
MLYVGVRFSGVFILLLKHDDKASCSRPEAVLVDLQLIEHDGHTLSAADRT